MFVLLYKMILYNFGLSCCTVLGGVCFTLACACVLKKVSPRKDTAVLVFARIPYNNNSPPKGGTLLYIVEGYLMGLTTYNCHDSTVKRYGLNTFAV